MILYVEFRPTEFKGCVGTLFGGWTGFTGSGITSDASAGALIRIDSDGRIGMGLTILSNSGISVSSLKCFEEDSSDRCFASNSSTSLLVDGIDISAVPFPIPGDVCDAILPCIDVLFMNASCFIRGLDREAARVAAIYDVEVSLSMAAVDILATFSVCE